MDLDFISDKQNQELQEKLISIMKMMSKFNSTLI